MEFSFIPPYCRKCVSKMSSNHFTIKYLIFLPNKGSEKFVRLRIFISISIYFSKRYHSTNHSQVYHRDDKSHSFFVFHLFYLFLSLVASSSIKYSSIFSKCLYRDPLLSLIVVITAVGLSSSSTIFWALQLNIN